MTIVVYCNYFYVVIPDTTLSEVARRTKGYQLNYSGGSVTELMRNFDNAYILCNSERLPVYQYRINAGEVIFVYDNKTSVSFSGTYHKFCQFAGVDKNLQDAVDKVVKFTYKSSDGTYPRVVKLTRVSGNGAGTVLHGLDIKKSTADTPAYRNYRVGNIVGQVEVVG